MTTSESAKSSTEQNRFWFSVLGIALIVLGVLAIAFPFATTIAAKTVFGWLLLLGGVLQIIYAFQTQKWSGFFFDLLVGILYLITGGWLAFFPLAGIITLTVLIAATFVAQGILELMLAFRLRPLEGWGWVLFSGAIAIAAGLLILGQLPSSAAWAIGLLVGINMISSGWAYFFLARAVK